MLWFTSYSSRSWLDTMFIHFLRDTLCGVMVSKIEQPTITSEFDSHWVIHFCSLANTIYIYIYIYIYITPYNIIIVPDKITYSMWWAFHGLRGLNKNFRENGVNLILGWVKSFAICNKYVKHNPAGSNTSAKFMKGVNHIGLWDAELFWFSPCATHQICL